MKPLFKCFVLASLCVVGLVSLASAQEAAIVGRWKSIDEKTNEPKSIVKIYTEDGKYYGQIVDLFRKPEENPDPVCDKCPADDPRKDQPIRGMVIIRDLVAKDGKYGGGTILDPAEGKQYKCKLWVEDGNLMVRGYVAFFFRTQVWQRVD